ncbi:MAG TPA: hypothetical protein PLE74_13090 [Candidatus Cloacimonadota bacterium]|nr:hypothetical protein [Candidatus Cloacimonadota bacterium]
MKKDITNEKMKGLLSDYVKLKFVTFNDLTSNGYYKGFEEFLKSEELYKFITIQYKDGIEDENRNEFVIFFDKSSEFEKYVVYTVNVKTLEVKVLLIEDDFKKVSRYFFGLKFFYEYFDFEDNLDDGEILKACDEDGVIVNYVDKIENNEIVSTIELNEYRLSKGLKPIYFNTLDVEDFFKVHSTFELGSTKGW